MAQVLDGKRIRDEILAESKPRVERLAASRRPPGLAVVLVGNDPASEIYVRNKVKACQELGIHSEKLTPPADISTEALIGIVEGLNERCEIDGVLVQVPLPAHLDTKRVLLAVDPAKDVDGFHPMNLGNLVTNRPGPRACTPFGILQLLKRYHVPISGRHAVVVGRSDTVGKPMAFLLLHENATVTICHSRTSNLAEICSQGDILVAAMGQPAFLTADHIKPGATVIDVGMNRLTGRERVERIFARSPRKLEEFEKKGTVLVGDVHPEDVANKAGAYTPVPGGVGPLTVAMLMVNTIESAERRLGLRCSG